VARLYTQPVSELERLAQVVVRQQRQLAELRSGAAGDALVEQAKGVLVERLGCSLAEASGHLTRLAEGCGRSPVELAAELLGTSVPDGAVPVVGRQLAEARIGLTDALFTEALAPTGAVAVVIWRLAPDGALILVGQRGLGAAEAAAWSHLPPQFGASARQAVGQPLWLPSGVDDPALSPGAATWRDGARAVLPIRNSRSGLGVLEVVWPDPRGEFTTGQRVELSGLAALCGRTLESRDITRESSPLAAVDHLLDSTMIAHAERDGSEVVDFVIDHVNDRFADPHRRSAELVGARLLEQYPLAARDGGLFDQAVRVLETGLPAEFEDEDSGVRVRVVRLYDGVAISWHQLDDAELALHALRLGQLGGWEESLVTGRVSWTAQTYDVVGTRQPLGLRDFGTSLGPDGASATDRFLNALINGRRAATAVLNSGEGATRRLRVFAKPVIDAAGEVVAVRGALQDVTAHYHTEAAMSATAQRADEQQRLAIQLQHAIIPESARAVDTTGMDIAVRYRPAAAEQLVGGDWYDAFTLPSGQVLLVVGDIAGHGIPVVTGMIGMRNALRGLAMTGASPGKVLSWLNISAASLPERVSGTVLCGVYDPATTTLLWARAGHLPPVLVRDSVAELLPVPKGPLLGAFTDPVYEEATVALRPDDRLVLFTDGLVERPGRDLDECLDELLEAAGEPSESIEDYADRLLSRDTSRDDTCLLTLRVR
jgi:Stage II sporulation protein E (SpoIIE)/ANTAR domain